MMFRHALGVMVLAALLGGAAFITPALADKTIAETIAGHALVHDGDTIRIGRTSIRIWGIDAAELKQTCGQDTATLPCGEMARDALAAIVADKPVKCIAKGKSYNRIVGQCFVDGQDIAAMMTRMGMAYDYTRYSRHAYAGDEAQAKEAAIGLWSMDAQNPAAWRACHLRPKDKRPASC